MCLPLQCKINCVYRNATHCTTTRALSRIPTAAMSSAAGVVRVATSYAVITATMQSAKPASGEISAARSFPTYLMRVTVQVVVWT